MAVTQNPVQERIERAARERLFVHRTAPATFDVYSTEGRKHTVDLVDEVCTCEDYQYRGDRLGTCKHLERIKMELGDREIPDVDNPDPIMLANRSVGMHD